jgi:hypothetical protein
MGILSFFSKTQPTGAEMTRLPTGSFTVDGHGRIIVSTLPQTFSQNVAKDIGRLILDTFHSAQETQLPLTELIIQYSALKITARSLRGGAIIFFTPRA